VCALHCAQLLHTILHRTDLIIFPLISYPPDNHHCIGYTFVNKMAVVGEVLVFTLENLINADHSEYILWDEMPHNRTRNLHGIKLQNVSAWLRVSRSIVCCILTTPISLYLPTTLNVFNLFSTCYTYYLDCGFMSGTQHTTPLIPYREVLSPPYH